MAEITELLRELASIDGTSGDEGAVRDFILQKIKPFCEYRVDNLGSIIAFKKGEKRPSKKLMVDAHTDEVGMIITSVTSDGFLKFKTVGGIDTAALLCRRVRINGSIIGVIGMKPVHLTHGDEGKKPPKAETLYIDIGASDEAEALSYITPGDCAVFADSYAETGDSVFSKAIDDRIGCAVLINLLSEPCEYDFYASFSVQEEVGLRGARATAFSIEPDAAIVLEGTTAADIADVKPENRVCMLGNGAAVSFMDGATVYDRKYYNAALDSGIQCQAKCAVAGGNNSGAIHLNREGVRTLAISVPCRYIHSGCSVADKNDFQSAYNLAKYMINGICSGDID